ncbi:MAG TPA: Gfo/Idh/MocA family oxidoreductase, partial [Verrucomicrobiae bacterium]|nr:Gfo/Idh/MocA family oxidoreductase [Verrucomicrobiae bacterium]
MKNITRRNFLKTTLATAAAVNVPFPSITQEISPSDEVRVAVIGFHGRGGDHISGFSNRRGSRLTALCDVDKIVLEGQVKKMEEKGVKVEAYKDVRKLLESKNVDAVSIATPNHWHSLMAIWAIQA